MIGHIPYGCGLLEAAGVSADDIKDGLVVFGITEIHAMGSPDKDQWKAGRRLGKLILLRNSGYDRTRVPDAPAVPLDCARRRGEHFVERMRAHRSACAKERMGYDGRDLVPEMPNNQAES